MATKPLSSTLPRWADTVAGDPSKVSEPPSGKKDIGWIVGEKPPAQWKNWLLLQCYNWLVWLDAFETESHTWTKLQTFTASVAEYPRHPRHGKRQRLGHQRHWRRGW
jgi:hypothetical protein